MERRRPSASSALRALAILLPLRKTLWRRSGLVRNRYPKMLLCVASNGLEVAAHAAQLAQLQVSHVTLTVNAVDPEIGARIYTWVRAGIRVLRGVEGAAVLLERQRAAIAELKKHGRLGQDQHHRHAWYQRPAHRRRGSRSGR